MGLLSRWKEHRIIKNVYREDEKKRKRLMKHARKYHRKKSLSEETSIYQRRLVRGESEKSARSGLKHFKK